MLTYVANLAFFSKLGKRQRSVVAATSVNGQLNNRLFLPDRVSGLLFLIDSGDDLSALPPSFADHSSRSSFILAAANGTLIATYGQKSITPD